MLCNYIPGPLHSRDIPMISLLYPNHIHMIYPQYPILFPFTFPFCSHKTMLNSFCWFFHIYIINHYIYNQYIIISLYICPQYGHNIPILSWYPHLHQYPWNHPPGLQKLHRPCCKSFAAADAGLEPQWEKHLRGRLTCHGKAMLYI